MGSTEIETLAKREREREREKATYKRIHTRHRGHILATRQDQLMINDIIRQHATATQRTSRMQPDRNPRPQIDILPHPPHPRRLMIKARTDTPPHHIPIRATTHHLEPLHLHDGGQLLADLARAPQRLGVQEMAGAPGIRAVVAAPLRVDVEEGEVVGFGDGEFVARRVRFGLLVARALEDGRHREHGDDGEHFVGAGVGGGGGGGGSGGGGGGGRGGEEQFGERGVHGEGGHEAAERGEVAEVGERAEGPEVEE